MDYPTLQKIYETPNGNYCAISGPSTKEFLKYKNTEELCALVFTSIFTIFTIVIFLFEINRKKKQNLILPQRNHIMWLLALYPILSSTCLISVWSPKTAPVTDLFNTMYFSVCLVKFFQLIVLYFGGEENMCEVLCGRTMSIAQPPLLCFCGSCLPSVTITRKVITNLKRLIQQFVFVPALLVYISAIIERDNPQTFYVSTIFQVVRMISTMLAFYGIITFLRVVLPILIHHDIKKKFVVMKLAIFFSHIQSFIINSLSLFEVIPCSSLFSSEYRAMWINNCLMTAEMLLLSIFASYVYWNECASEVYELLPFKGKDGVTINSKSEVSDNYTPLEDA